MPLNGMFPSSPVIQENAFENVVCETATTLSRPEQNGNSFAVDILNAFSWIETFEFWIIFHWNILLAVYLATSQHWLGQWRDRWQAITWANADPFQWRTYTSPGTATRDCLIWTV